MMYILSKNTIFRWVKLLLFLGGISPICAGNGMCQLCDPNMFCYNGTATFCPVNSSSVAGSVSYDDCKCNDGYIDMGGVVCTLPESTTTTPNPPESTTNTSTTEANTTTPNPSESTTTTPNPVAIMDVQFIVVLNVSLSEFSAIMQTAFIAKMSNFLGITPSDVEIVNITENLVSGRRLLATTSIDVEVKLSVQLDSLNETLQKLTSIADEPTDMQITSISDPIVIPASAVVAPGTSTSTNETTAILNTPVVTTSIVAPDTTTSIVTQNPITSAVVVESTTNVVTLLPITTTPEPKSDDPILSDTMIIIIISCGGVVLILTFYCVYRCVSTHRHKHHHGYHGVSRTAVQMSRRASGTGMPVPFASPIFMPAMSLRSELSARSDNVNVQVVSLDTTDFINTLNLNHGMAAK